MKLLKPAYDPNNPSTDQWREWWVGEVATCPICGAIVEFEAGDPVYRATRLGHREVNADEPGVPDTNEIFKVYIDCPTGHGFQPSISLQKTDL